MDTSAITKNVVIKHPLTEATNKCSGIIKPSTPLGILADWLLQYKFRFSI
jgi:hypothetical protein